MDFFNVVLEYYNSLHKSNWICVFLCLISIDNCGFIDENRMYTNCELLYANLIFHSKMAS